MKLEAGMDEKAPSSKVAAAPAAAPAPGGQEAGGQHPLVKEQGDLVRKLKSAKASKEEVMAAVAKLKELKAEYGDGTPAPAPPKAAAKEPQGGKIILKTAKGTRDYQPNQVLSHLQNMLPLFYLYF